MQLLSPQFLKDRDLLPLGKPRVEKGCCFAGQIALFRKMAAVPEGLPWQATPATGSFRRKFNCCTKTSTRVQPAGSPEVRHNIQELWFL